MSKQEFSIPKLASMVQTEADAYLLLEELRWGGHPQVCPQCGGMDRCYFLQPKDGSTGRKTRTGANTQRRVYKCGHCRKQFSVLTGTIFHGTKISIRTWLLVIFEVCSSKNSVSAWEISRKYEITNESAWHMLHRIREAMKMEPVVGLLGGAVQVDKTWIGGDPKNRHRNDPREKPRGWHESDKQPVVSLVHYETRSAHSRVVADDDRLIAAASHRGSHVEVMDPKRTWLHTDSGSGYKAIASQFAAHEYVDHSVGEVALRVDRTGVALAGEASKGLLVTAPRPEPNPDPRANVYGSGLWSTRYELAEGAWVALSPVPGCRQRIAVW